VPNTTTGRFKLTPNVYTVKNRLKYYGGEHSSTYLPPTAEKRPEDIPWTSLPNIKRKILGTIYMAIATKLRKHALSRHNFLPFCTNHAPKKRPTVMPPMKKLVTNDS
jgi:hypothetical protein